MTVLAAIDMVMALEVAQYVKQLSTQHIVAGMAEIVEYRTANNLERSSLGDLEDKFGTLAITSDEINNELRQQSDAEALMSNEHEIDGDNDDEYGSDDFDEVEASHEEKIVCAAEENRSYRIRCLQRCAATTRREPEKKFKNGTRMSLHFSNDRMREIERSNQILLKKILTNGPIPSMTSTSDRTKPTATSSLPISRATSATINRRKQQLQIDRNNEILLKKLQRINRNK